MVNGIEYYLKNNHPLHPSAQNTDAGGLRTNRTAFAGQSNPHRDLNDVRRDIYDGHKFLGSDTDRIGSMSHPLQVDYHQEAEMIGYHMNKHNYIDREQKRATGRN